MEKGYEVYSGLNELPSGRAGDKVTPGCMVLEGGAFRGLYTSGVLDALMQHDINLQCTVGVSAGAMNGLPYATGQIGYSARINLGHRHDKKYVGLGAWPKNKGIIGFDVAFSAPDGLEPLDLERISALNRSYYAVATNCNTGRTEFIRYNDSDEILTAIQASASMPYISKMVKFHGEPYLDGGCSCKIPYKWAVKRCFEKIVVVRTREKSFRRDVNPQKDCIMPKIFYARHPAFARKLSISNQSYNLQCEEMDQLEADGKIFVISPSEPVTVARVEGDMEKLGNLYYLGYNDALECMDKLREYLEIK